MFAPHDGSISGSEGLVETAISSGRLVELDQYLRTFMTPSRTEIIDRVVETRTRTVVPVLEGLYDRGNVSAVIRSAEAFGFQEMHVIESQESFREANRVTQGADKWLDIRKWKTTRSCVEALKTAGYKVVATDLETQKSIEDCDFSVKTAIVFGNEGRGITEEMRELADERVKFPMLGFTQSFNISVAAAICFHHIYRDRFSRLGRHGDLNESERMVLRVRYAMESIGRSDLIVEEFLNGKRRS